MGKVRFDPTGFQVMDQVGITKVLRVENFKLALRDFKGISVKRKILDDIIPIGQLIQEFVKRALVQFCAEVY
jgi:hypothetical protein